MELRLLSAPGERYSSLRQNLIKKILILHYTYKDKNLTQRAACLGCVPVFANKKSRLCALFPQTMSAPLCAHGKHEEISLVWSRYFLNAFKRIFCFLFALTLYLRFGHGDVHHLCRNGYCHDIDVCKWRLLSLVNGMSPLEQSCQSLVFNNQNRIHEFYERF